MRSHPWLKHPVCHLLVYLLLFSYIRSSIAQTPHPTFEVATVKRAPAQADPNTGSWSPPNIGRFSATHVTLSLLIQLAYGVDKSQIANQPGWLDTNLYDIVAKPEDGVLLSAMSSSRAYRICSISAFTSSSTQKRATPMLTLSSPPKAVRIFPPPRQIISPAFGLTSVLARCAVSIGPCQSLPNTSLPPQTSPLSTRPALLGATISASATNRIPRPTAPFRPFQWPSKKQPGLCSSRKWSLSKRSSSTPQSRSPRKTKQQSRFSGHIPLCTD